MNTDQIIERTIELTSNHLKRTVQPNMRKNIIQQMKNEINAAAKQTEEKLSYAQPTPPAESEHLPEIRKDDNDSGSPFLSRKRRSSSSDSE